MSPTNWCCDFGTENYRKSIHPQAVKRTSTTPYPTSLSVEVISRLKLSVGQRLDETAVAALAEERELLAA